MNSAPCIFMKLKYKFGIKKRATFLALFFMPLYFYPLPRYGKVNVLSDEWDYILLLPILLLVLPTRLGIQDHLNGVQQIDKNQLIQNRNKHLDPHFLPHIEELNKILHQSCLLHQKKRKSPYSYQ